MLYYEFTKNAFSALSYKVLFGQGTRPLCLCSNLEWVSNKSDDDVMLCVPSALHEMRRQTLALISCTADSASHMKIPMSSL